MTNNDRKGVFSLKRSKKEKIKLVYRIAVIYFFPGNLSFGLSSDYQAV